jgi:hypothetical protein
MKPLIKNYQALSPYNKAVHNSFGRLLSETFKLLATVERHELRCYLYREDKSDIAFGSKVFKLISPLLYLSLECEDGKLLCIHFGFELLQGDSQYSPIISRFVRMLYTFTAKENTAVNIEDSINTNYVIYDCSALYETVEDRMRHHTLKVIPYKSSANRRKQMQAVA